MIRIKTAKEWFKELILDFIFTDNERKVWRYIMSKDLKKGNWFENQDEISDRVQNLDSDGNLNGDVIGDVTGDVITDSIETENSLEIRSAAIGGVSIVASESFSVTAPTEVVLLYGTEGIRLDGLPTSDPLISNHLWIDTSAGRVIKVSAGA